MKWLYIVNLPQRHDVLAQFLVRYLLALQLPYLRSVFFTGPESIVWKKG
jgi:hypothetical protein